MPHRTNPNRAVTALEKRYFEALQVYLRDGTKGKLAFARDQGRSALPLGLETLDLARMHERSLVKILVQTSSISKDALVKRAVMFFTEAITPIEKTHRAAINIGIRLGKLNNSLIRRSAELAASNQQLLREVAQRKRGESALKKSEKECSQALATSLLQQQELRQLSRRFLAAQEEERRRISRELHDVVAQMLIGINLQLATLKKCGTRKSSGLSKNIDNTQRLVAKSVDIVHRFARELRPAMLDDLGLIPALKTHLADFTKTTGIRIGLTTFDGLELLNHDTRTVLYRVIQEALSNISRHAKASRGEVIFEKSKVGVCMRITDNGQSFDPSRVWQSRGIKRLGLVGMRERLEMIGGTFVITGSPGHGTTVETQIPLGPKTLKKAKS